MSEAGLPYFRRHWRIFHFRASLKRVAPRGAKALVPCRDEGLLDLSDP